MVAIVAVGATGIRHHRQRRHSQPAGSQPVETPPAKAFLVF
jgi:hypothetical protein